jgi:putative transposase
MVVTLEPPSATSVGLCLAHMTSDKRTRLDDLEVKAGWPMAGKSERLYVDNAAEFKSEALRRGCEQHGVELSYRPLGRPHYGGSIERIIGTVMGGCTNYPAQPSRTPPNAEPMTLTNRQR